MCNRKRRRRRRKQRGGIVGSSLLTIAEIGMTIKKHKKLMEREKKINALKGKYEKYLRSQYLN